MIYTSLAVLAMSASAVINPFSNLVHMHPRPAQPDTRIRVTLYNNTLGFRDVKIDGHTYTVLEHHSLDIKAPVGTVVYAASRTSTHRRGDAILEVKPELDHQRVNLN
jgi:hypothetical protein